MATGEIYINIGLTEALGIPFPDETVDEDASARKAEELLYLATGDEFDFLSYHIDWGGEPPFVHADDDALAASFEQVLVPATAELLKQTMHLWTIHREPYIGRVEDWQEALKRLKRRGFLDEHDALDSYIGYHMRKFEENAILVTDETVMVIYLGPSDSNHLINAVEQCNIRRADRNDQHNPDKVTEIVYPLTAAETGFEGESQCDIIRSLDFLAYELEQASREVFPHATFFFPIFPTEKEKTGSLSLYANDRLLYHAYSLEKRFFEIAGDVVMNTEKWFVADA